jgi:hypothetical protein
MNPWKTAARHRDAPIDPTITLTLGALVKVCKKLVSTIISSKKMTIYSVFFVNYSVKLRCKTGPFLFSLLVSSIYGLDVRNQ